MRIATFAAVMVVCCASADCHAQTASATDNAIIVIGNQGSITDALKSASQDKRLPNAKAFLSKNYLSKTNPLDLGGLDVTGLRIINNLKSTDGPHFYRFSLSTAGTVVISASKTANVISYGIMELGGTLILSKDSFVGGDLSQFFPPGDYMIFAGKLERPTPYQLSIKFNPE